MYPTANSATAGFLGPEMQAPGKYGLAQPPKPGNLAEEGLEPSFSHSFGAGISGGRKDANSVGVTYSCR